MLVLYGAETGNAFRAAISLCEAELPFEARVVNLRGGEQRTDAFLKINPAGQVPVLVDQGRPLILTQSNAIILHAAEHSKATQLLPAEPFRRARVLERFFYFASEAIPWSGASFRLGMVGNGEGAADLERLAVERIRASERFLAGTPYIAGDAFSIADIVGFTIARFYLPKLELNPGNPLLHWLDRVEARPAVQRGLAAFKTMPAA